MEKIGTGKFSNVFRAESKRNVIENEYAIKVIDKNDLKEGEMELIQYFFL